MVFDLLNEVLPKDSVLSKNFYQAKQLRKRFKFEYKSIDAHMNDCGLFWKKNEEKQDCPICEESRWKRKKYSSENIVLFSTQTNIAKVIYV